MSEHDETLAEIVAEKRAQANKIERVAGCDANQFQRELIHDLRAEADRIEAAAKRERTTTTVGNAAAMREALRTLRQRFDNNVMAYQDRYFKFSGWHWHKKAAEAARWRDVFHELREACDAALSSPSRNCDRFGGDFKMLHTAWFDWTGSLSGQNPDGTAKLTFAEWLLATKKETR